MGFEKPKQKSEGFGLHEEWEELGGIILKFPIMPIQILGDLIGDLFGSSDR